MLLAALAGSERAIESRCHSNPPRGRTDRSRQQARVPQQLDPSAAAWPPTSARWRDIPSQLGPDPPGAVSINFTNQSLRVRLHNRRANLFPQEIRELDTAHIARARKLLGHGVHGSDCSGRPSAEPLKTPPVHGVFVSAALQRATPVAQRYAAGPAPGKTAPDPSADRAPHAPANP